MEYDRSEAAAFASTRYLGDEEAAPNDFTIEPATRGPARAVHENPWASSMYSHSCSCRSTSAFSSRIGAKSPYML